MKRLVFLTIILASSFANAGDKLTLRCPGLTDEIQSNEIQISKDLRVASVDAMDLPRETNGDCEGREAKGLICFQDGQFMLNVSRALLTGKRKTGKVWVNSDVDDDDSNDRKGISYVCTIERK